jgi:hypothetical protein
MVLIVLGCRAETPDPRLENAPQTYGHEQQERGSTVSGRGPALNKIILLPGAQSRG